MDLAVAAIIKAENIEASDEEVEAEYKKMAEQFGMDVDMVKKYLAKEQVHDQLLSQKAVAVVVDSATAEKPKKAAKKAEAALKGEEKKPAKKTTKKAEAADGERSPRRLPLRRLPRRKKRKPNKRRNFSRRSRYILQIRHILSWYPWYHERMVYQARFAL